MEVIFNFLFRFSSEEPELAQAAVGVWLCLLLGGLWILRTLQKWFTRETE